MWLQPAGFVPLALGGLALPLTASVAVPNNPLLLGPLYGWQGVAFDAASGIDVTNPTLFTP